MMRMSARLPFGIAAGIALTATGLQIVGPPAAHAAAQVTAMRLPQNPLVTLQSSASLGDNINGPTIIRGPSWIEQPLGRYYMYFAHHMGAYVRLAYADSIAGPWTVHEPGVLPVNETAFFRPQPDPVGNRLEFIA